MSVHHQMPLWNHASIRVLDIRRSAVPPGDSVRLRLPASTFLYAASGRGQIHIDGAAHASDGCYICHAGKGASLDIVRVAEAIDYFLIFYKAVMPHSSRRELLELYRDRNPFRAGYGFAPADPLPLYTRIEQMHRQWLQNDPLEKFHVRALLHQFVYEVMKQRQLAGSAETLRIDPVGRAIRHIEEHYAEPLSLHALAELVNCGPRQLQRRFKERCGIGPIEYLIRVRMNHAQAMLLHTAGAVKDIAEAVGYDDLYYFSRAFKKHFGASPMHFRRDRRISSSSVSPSSIGLGRVLPYSVVDDENHYQLTDGGASLMHTRTRSMLAVHILLIVMLLMGACSAGSGGSPAASPGTSAAPGAAQIAQQAFPVTIKHVKGEYTLEQKPERIAVLDVQYVDQLVALNEQPAGSVKAAGAAADFPEYLAGKLKDVKVLGTYEQPNLEAILEINPDFIICTEVHESIYESLSKIAPTVMLKRNDDWRDTLLTFGQITGKEKEAEQAVQAYKEKTARLAADLAAKLDGQTVALIRPRDDMIRVHTPGHRTGAILYKDLGLKAPQQVAEANDTAYHVSLEALADVGADHYFLLTDDMFKGLVEEFQSTTTWKSLEPVKNNRVYTVDTTMWIGYYGPMAINLVVDQIADTLLGTH